MNFLTKNGILEQCVDLESEWKTFDNVEFWQGKVVFVGMLYKKESKQKFLRSFNSTGL